MIKKTLVIGASDNPSRYSYLAVQRLRKHGHDVVAIGRAERKGCRRDELVHPREILTRRQQAVVKVGINVDTLAPERLGQHGQ